MSGELQISRLRFDYKGLEMRYVWSPARTLAEHDCEALIELVWGLNATSASPFQYGFFSPALSRAERREFMGRSCWCVVYKDGQACGFGYNYDVGAYEGRRLIHLGLVKFYVRLGRDAVKAVYNGLTLGNLVNFGPHHASNISHVPLIIDLACHYIQRAFPHPRVQDPELRRRYLPLLELLITNYMEPLLGYARSQIDRQRFRVPGALDMHASGFESAWEDLPKSDETLCNLFVKDWLTLKTERDGRLHVKDDLIQIGTIDYGVFSAARNDEVYNQMRALPVEPGPAFARGQSAPDFAPSSVHR